MLTNFTVPKPFTGGIKIIQENAILSWLNLKPCPRIVLIGNEKGVQEYAHVLGLQHIPTLKKNRYGTPLVSSIWNLIKAKSTLDVIGYVNTDIIFTNQLVNKINIVKKDFNKYLLIGKRYEVMITKKINFATAWQKKLDRKVFEEGTIGGDGWIDYFIFTRNTFSLIPDFALGRTFWDKWLVWNALQRNIPVIDAGDDSIAIHQSHTYEYTGGTENVWLGKEARQNIILAGGWAHGASIGDAQYKIKNEQIIKKPTVFIGFYSLMNGLKNIFNIGFLFDIALYLRMNNVAKKLRLYQ
jgi:hypothetical protein